MHKLKWQLGDWESIQFWRDKWLGEMMLGDIALRSLIDHERTKSVATYWQSDHLNWNWNELHVVLPLSILQTLAAIVIPSRSIAHEYQCLSTRNTTACEVSELIFF